jgi:hypothetical protein
MGVPLDNADEEGGYFTPSWSGDPTPIEHPDMPGEKPYLWEKYKEWTGANPFHGVIKAPELVPPENDTIVRKKNEGPRHWAIHHDPVKDRDKVYAFYTCRHDLPESIVVVIFDLAGLTETERLDPSLWIEIATGVENTHYYTWTIPDTPSDIAQVRITETGGDLVAASDPFLIAAKKALFMVRPTVGASVLAGSEYGLNWASVGDISQVDLAYTLNGTEWITIADSVPNPGPFAWTVPDIETNDVRIRISETDSSLESISDPFSIASEMP